MSAAKLVLLACLSIFVLLSCSSATSDPNRRLTLQKTETGLYATKVRVNGRGPIDMVVDTAAQTTSIKRSALHELGLEDTQDKHWIVHGLFSSESTTAVDLDSFVAGGFELSGSFVVIPDDESLTDPNVEGLIGADFISARKEDARYLMIDLPNRRIMSSNSLTGLGLPSTMEWSSLDPAGAERNFLSFPIRSDGITALAIVDTGLQFSVINQTFADLLVEKGRNLEHNTLQDVNGVQQTLKTVRLGRISGARTRWSSAKTLVYDSPALTRIVSENRPAMLLGVSHLSDLTIVVDQLRRRIALGPEGKMGLRSACDLHRTSCAGDFRISKTD